VHEGNTLYLLPVQGSDTNWYKNLLVDPTLSISVVNQGEIAVDIGRKEIYHNPDRFGWTGGFSTTAYIDPRGEMIGILFTQRMMDSPEPPKVFTDFLTLAYGAME
jgi:CubicO group peptidase (beta-lactamase class C family)